MKIEDLNKGEIYKFEWEYEGKTVNSIFRFNYNVGLDIHYIIGLFPHRTYEPIIKNSEINSIKENKLSIPSAEEKHWFLECEKANKFIYKEEALKSFNQPKLFEVGRWYKNLGSNHIAKAINNSRIEEGNRFYHGDWLYKGKYFYKGDEANSWLEWKSNTCECPLEEVQEFLPDGHPDKLTDIKVTTFKKDSYIVTLNSNGVIGFPSNYCFKQREDFYYIRPYLDTVGSNTNGWEDIKVDNPSTYRYATLEEIAEYNRLGKPYDVTTLSKSKELTSLPKEWYIKVENNGFPYVVNKWRLSNKKGTWFNAGYIDHIGFHSTNKPNYGVEITLDQFNKWIRNPIEPIDDTKWIPKIGDLVEITKSNENWVKPMNSFVGSKVLITNIRKVQGIHFIEFKDDKDFSWCLEQGHFKKCVESENLKGKPIPQYVELLIDASGCKKGDIAKVVKNLQNDYEVLLFVPHRTPTGLNSPNILFNVANIKASTKEQYDQQLLDEARRRYPKGIKYKSLYINGECANIEYTVDFEVKPYYFTNDSIALKSNKGIVYVDGKWAKVVEEENEMYNYHSIDNTIYPAICYRLWSENFYQENIINIKPNNFDNIQIEKSSTKELLVPKQNNLLDTNINKVKSLDINLIENKKVLLF
jgi:hypothetical protein